MDHINQLQNAVKLFYSKFQTLQENDGDLLFYEKELNSKHGGCPFKNINGHIEYYSAYCQLRSQVPQALQKQFCKKQRKE